MSTTKCESDKMRCSTGNILKRPAVFSEERKLKNNKRHSQFVLGFNEISEEVQNFVMEQWPKELRRSFNEMMQDSNIDDKFERIISVLRGLKNKKLTSEHRQLVADALIHLQNSSSDSLTSNEDHDDGSDGEEEEMREEVLPDEPNQNKRSTTSVKHVLFIVGGCVALIAVSLSLFKSKVDTISESNKIDEWERNIKSLKEKFPSQNRDIWFDILSGVKTVVTEKPAQPSVFLLLHNDKRTSACLANEVGKEAVKFLSESSQEPIIIRGEELKRNHSLITDYGLFSETYKHDIERKRVMIVLDLQEIPAVLAQTFHALCDVENPLVRDAAILFTMQIEENEGFKPTAIAERNLKSLWQDFLDVDIMDPLITRVTNVVLPVKIETNLPC